MSANVIKSLRFAIQHCINTGNVTGAYVYTRILTRYVVARLNTEPHASAHDRYHRMLDILIQNGNPRPARVAANTLHRIQ
jgi:hypothetical protein